MSVKFGRVLWSVLDFLTLEDGTDRFFRNVGKVLSPNTAYYLRREDISHDDLVMQATVWLHTIRLRVIQFGAVQFSLSYVNLRQPLVLVKGKAVLLQAWGGPEGSRKLR
jgi:hypothetical protein